MADIYVSAATGNDANDGSNGSPFKTIQAALDAAPVGSTIHVAGGTYTGNLVISKAVTLLGDGRTTTNIVGISNGAGGTVSVAASDVTIKGFTIQGIDGPSPASEASAIYLQTTQSNVTIQDNKIVANGEAAILSVYGVTHSNVIIDNNEITGQTFTGPTPGGGAPGDNQFVTPNWPRPLVFFGSNNDDAHQSSIQFTNNLVSGTSGGINAYGNPWGNVLVNIDAPGAIIDGNQFTGYVIGFQPMLRVREENTHITDNTFSNANGGNTTILIDADAAVGSEFSGNTGGTVVHEGTSGAETVNGTDANDYFVADGGNDTYNGFGGSDTIDMTAAGTGGSTVDLRDGTAFSSATNIDTFTSIENAKGSAGADALFGSDGDNVFIASGGADIVDGRGGTDTFDASAATAAVNLNLDTHAVSGAFAATLTSVEVIKGGSGFDVATTTSTMAATPVGWDSSAGGFTVAGQTLVNFDKVQHSDHATWLVKTSAELTYALANSADGDVIKMAPGKYVGSFTVGHALTIESANGDASSVVLSGNFKSLNGMNPGDSVATFLQTHPGYTGVNGITISHDNVTINNITISEYVTGLGLGSASHINLNNVNFTSNVTAVNKNTASVVSDFNWNGGYVTDGQHGATINAAKVDDDPTAGVHYVVAGSFTDIDITGVVFTNLNEKGLYFEQLDHADIHNIYMYNVGQYGRTTPFGGDGTFGTGIDINLKYGNYTDIEIYNFDFDNVGASNKNGAGASHEFGAGITVKARNDGSDYSNPPANVTDVKIHDGTIDGTSTGIRIGEPTKANVGPTGVIVTDVEVRTAAIADFDNRSGATLTVNIDSSGGDQNVSSNPDATGVIAYVDNGDGDTTYTVNPQDTVTENSGIGTDTVNARGSFTLGANVENLNLIDAGTDTQNFEDFSTGPIANGENGWTVLAADSDQAVVDLSGNHVFQMSSDPGSGNFAGPYSPNIGVTAGEPATSSDGDVHIIKFRVKPVDATGDNSRLEVDTGTAAGTDRNNFMVIESIAGQGLRIAVADPRLDGHWSTGNTDDNFVAFTGNRTLVSGLDTSVWHDIELRVLYVDGQNNDVIQIYVDGELAGTTTTFENYRDALGGTHAANAEANQTNRIFFRPGNGGTLQDGPGGTNKGFYFDDITNTVTTNSSGTGNGLDNVINGNSGHNDLKGLGGDDTINGHDGNDTIDGGTGTDVINGGRGNDLIKLAAGDNDVIDGGAGDDTVQIIGTAGDDTVSVTYNGSALTSLGGNVTNVEHISLALAGNTPAGDTLSYADSSVGVTVNLATNTASGFASISGVENVVGGSGTDSLTGDGNDNVLTGNGGSDEINGGGGTDTAVFSGNFADYTITAAGGGFNVARNGDSDHVVNVEKFQFDDRVVLSTSTGLITANPTFTTIPGLNTNENTAVGTTVYSVGATDANTVEGDVLTYSLQATGGGAYTGPFSIDSSGNIKTAGALDFEAATSHSFVVKVADSSGHTKTQTVTVTLNDLNDSPTVITSTAPTTVNENFTGVVYDVNATDADSSATFGAIAYSLSGADAGKFAIDSSGNVTFVTAPNFESQTSYSFTVQAKQGSGPAATQNVSLNVVDLNDNNPVFSSGNSATVAENSPVSTVVYDANATDADTSFGAIVYSLTGTDAGAFNINASTGQVRLNALPDFESKSSYSFSVVATQGTSSATQGVTLSVTNANEGIDGLGDVNLAVESGTTKLPLGVLADTGATFDIQVVNAGGGVFYNGSTILAAGQTGLTLAQINALTFSSVGSPASLQIVAHDGGDTEAFTVGIAVTPGESKTYTGTSGANHIDGANGNDNILGKNGADVLIGGAGKDTVDGGKGNDTIYGGKGHDELTGGKGEDHFVFDSALKAKHSDIITDFVTGTDKISLEGDIFSALGGSIGGGEVRTNTTGNAQDGNDKLIYNKSTGQLYFDADGNHSGAKVLIATLDPSHVTSLHASDFEIV